MTVPSSEPRLPHPIRRLTERGPLLPALVCVAGMLAYAWPMFASGFELTDRTLGDGRLVNFVLEHGYRWLIRMPLHTDFWNPPVFYPHENVSAYTHLLLGFGPVYWIWRAVGLEPDTAYQLWTLSVFVLNFASAHWLLNRGFGVYAPSACAGALLVALMGTQQSVHAQLMPLFYMLVGLHALVRLFSEDARTGARRAWIAVFFAAIVLQAWSEVYVLFFHLLMAVLGAAASCLVPRWRRALVGVLRRDLGWWALCAGLATACLVPLARRYGFVVEESGYRPFVPETVPYLLGWIFSHARQYPIRMDGYAPATLGVGAVTLVATVWGLWPWRARPAVRALVVALALMVLLCSRYFGLAPWKLVYDWVPGAGAIRAVFRVTMVAVPLAALGVALAARPRESVAASIVGLVLAVGAIAEHVLPMPSIPKTPIREQVARLARRVDPDARAFYAVCREPGARWVAEDAAWAALQTGVPTINGRYGHSPPGYGLGLKPGKNWRKDTAGGLEAALDDWLAAHDIDRSGIQWIEYEALTEAPRPAR